MKKYIYLFILLSLQWRAFGQHSNDLEVKGPKKIECEGTDENSTKKKQLPCVLIDIVTDGINYYPMDARKGDVAINSQELAFTQLIKLYPELEGRFSCWTEYKGYYIFSLDFPDQSEFNCSFLHIYYVSIGGDEFWYFWPHT